jgi:hypothetical protein
MGRASRAKRDRRAEAGFVAALTACEGSWLAKPPDAAEQQRIAAAHRELARHRAEAAQLAADENHFIAFSLEVLRDPRFQPLHYDDWVIERILERYGEPPVVEDSSDPAFSDYLRTAVLDLADSRVRRAMAEQVRRFLPQYVEAGQVREALALERNAYLTVMSDAATPLLVQMLVGGLARWYEEHEEEDEPMRTAEA